MVTLWVTIKGFAVKIFDFKSMLLKSKILTAKPLIVSLWVRCMLLVSYAFKILAG